MHQRIGSSLVLIMACGLLCVQSLPVPIIVTWTLRRVTFDVVWIKTRMISFELIVFESVVYKITAISFCFQCVHAHFPVDFVMRWLFTTVLLIQAVNLIQSKFLESSKKFCNELLVQINEKNGRFEVYAHAFFTCTLQHNLQYIDAFNPHCADDMRWCDECI